MTLGPTHKAAIVAHRLALAMASTVNEDGGLCSRDGVGGSIEADAQHVQLWIAAGMLAVVEEA